MAKLLYATNGFRAVALTEQFDSCGRAWHQTWLTRYGKFFLVWAFNNCNRFNGIHVFYRYSHDVEEKNSIARRKNRLQITLRIIIN
ncbi:Uncharacterised protein [Vibrio cholerae]|nr:Uncharacterised protein [Vibrio cholerae]CSD50670.1 Uncharacterised protein [Vibrio cholerae]